MRSSLFALTILGMSQISAACKGDCKQTEAATCFPENCSCFHCLGPDFANPSANPPVNPKTCNGDVIWTVAALFFTSHQDGMEYAIQNNISIPIVNPTITDIQEINNLISSEYLTPSYRWDFGFRLGLSYVGCHDGWDIGVLWTHFSNFSSTHVEAENDDNQILFPLWSAFAAAQSGPLFARDIRTMWKLNLDLVDVELGREFWTSKYLTLRPFVGLRFAKIEQDFDIEHRGGSWSSRSLPDQNPYNNFVDLENNFKGAGLRAGLNSVWNLGCGWAFYGEFATSLIYGRFSLDHEEENRLAISDHSKTRVLQLEEGFRASRAILDLGLGIEWATTFCDCCYGLVARLGWEQHTFFNQNQMWRISRKEPQLRNGTVRIDGFVENLPNNNGENVFDQARGTLSTSGAVLSIELTY